MDLTHIDLSSWISAYYLGMSVAVILATMTTAFQQQFLFYGKLRTSNSTFTSSSWIHWLYLTVPKHRFKDFYLIGALWNAYLLFGILTDHLWSPLRAVMTLSFEQILVACLLQCQLLRRYYECVFVEKPSLTARMHVGHYIVGVSYYIVTCTATWCYFSMNPSTSIGLRHLLSVCLFTYASLHQYRCHSILAQLRSTSSASNSSSYSIPYGDWFHWVSSPHYFAELLIYVALSAILHFPLVWCCLLVWVVINLGTTAHMTHEWYRRHFNCYPIERAAFIPRLY